MLLASTLMYTYLYVQIQILSEHNNTLTSHCSPSSVADAIDHIAERIVAKAAEQATRVIDMEADRTKK